MKKTLLYDEHIKAGARMVDFSGWEMPIQYTGMIEEHKHTREHLSLFDTCHMGQLSLGGKDALAGLEKLVVSEMSTLAVGRCRYTMICDEQGGIVDDLVVYKLGEEEFALIVNAGPADGDFAWVKEKLGGADVSLGRRDAAHGKMDLQGPKSRDFLLRLAEQGAFKAATPLEELKWYRFTRCELFGTPMVMSRTGYTGEMGFELYPDSGETARVWQELLAAGDEAMPLKPAGLGARDSLRLEMGYPLYGHEHSRQVTPLDVGYGGRIAFAKGDFIGRDKLLAQKEKGQGGVVAGFLVKERAIPRAAAALWRGEEEAGRVTSGGFAPSLGHSVALALVAGEARQGEYAIEVRGRRMKAELAEVPFYQKGTVRGWSRSSELGTRS